MPYKEAVKQGAMALFGEKYDEREWKKGVRDHAVLQVGELWVEFVPREK